MAHKCCLNRGHVNDVQYAFDGRGNLIEEWQSHQGAVDTATTPSVQYSYDDGAASGVAKYNRLAAVTYPNGRKVSYDYSGAVDDIMSRLSAIYDDADSDGAIDPGEDVYAAYRYLGAGTIVAEDYVAAQTKLTYLDSGGDVVWLDRFGRVADQVWEHYYLDGSGNEVVDGTPDAYAYGYDRAGNRTSRENLTKTDGTLDESYSYDDLDRLTEWKVNGTTEQTWTLDALGNDRSAGTYSAANEETPTVGSSGYDAAGNMTTLTTGDTAVYDAWNRIAEVDDASGIVQKNAYDGANRRIEVSTDFTGSVPNKVADDYLAGQQVIETDLTVSGIRAGGYQNLWSLRYIDAPILRDTLTTSGMSIVTADRLFYLGDANYNVTGLLKKNATTGDWEAVERYTYAAYGAATVRDAVWVALTGNVSQFDNTILYTGRVLEPATGLMYYRARYYDTGLERFVGRDPNLFRSGDPNLYRYCLGEPEVRVDPLGLYSSADPLKYRVTDASYVESPTTSFTGLQFVVEYDFSSDLTGNVFSQNVTWYAKVIDWQGRTLRYIGMVIKDLAKLRKANLSGESTFTDTIGGVAGIGTPFGRMILQWTLDPKVCTIAIKQYSQWSIYKSVQVQLPKAPGNWVDYDPSNLTDSQVFTKTWAWWPGQNPYSEGKTWTQRELISDFRGVGDAYLSGGWSANTEFRRKTPTSDWHRFWDIKFAIGSPDVEKELNDSGNDDNA